MTDFAPSLPEKEEIVLSLVDVGVTLKNFSDYEFNSNFLTPTDGWSLTIGAGTLPDEVRQHLRCGAKVQLSINGAIQATGYIDTVEVNVSRSSGTVWHVGGRDVLAQAVDSCADPTMSLKPSQSLADAVKTILGPFGWPDDDNFEVANDASRNVKTGSSRGTPLTHGSAGGGKTKSGKPSKAKGPHPLKSFALHQMRPQAQEGAFAFASRISQRFALWIWPSADGKTLIVGRPDFEQDPIAHLRLNTTGTTNVLEMTTKFDVTDQPTVVIADGYSGGGEFGRSRVKSITANTAVFTKDPNFLEPYKKYKDANRVDGHAFSTPVEVPRNRVLYLHDDTSQTQEQLDNFVRRELALRQRKSMTVHCTVEGHGQITPDGFICWTPDTTVLVENEIAGVHEVMYVLGRTFSKSRSGGTTTKLELIRLNTISFGDPPKPAPKGDLTKGPKLQEDVALGKYHQYVEQLPSLDTAPRPKS